MNSSNQIQSMNNNNNINFIRTNSNIEKLVQQKLDQRKRVLSERSASNRTKSDGGGSGGSGGGGGGIEGKINRFYSFLLVKYHWVFLLVGITITVVLTGVSFVKQPLPNFLDPKRVSWFNYCQI